MPTKTLSGVSVIGLNMEEKIASQFVLGENQTIRIVHLFRNCYRVHIWLKEHLPGAAWETQRIFQSYFVKIDDNGNILYKGQ